MILLTIASGVNTKLDLRSVLISPPKLWNGEWIFFFHFFYGIMQSFMHFFGVFFIDLQRMHGVGRPGSGVCLIRLSRAVPAAPLRRSLQSILLIGWWWSWKKIPTLGIVQLTYKTLETSLNGCTILPVDTAVSLRGNKHCFRLCGFMHYTISFRTGCYYPQQSYALCFKILYFHTALIVTCLRIKQKQMKNFTQGM